MAVTFAFDARDLSLLRHAMESQLRRVEAEIALLRTAHERPLTPEERNTLSDPVRRLPSEELRDQLAPWESLRRHYAYWLEKFSEAYKAKT